MNRSLATLRSKAKQSKAKGPKTGGDLDYSLVLGLMTFAFRFFFFAFFHKPPMTHNVLQQLPSALFPSSLFAAFGLRAKVFVPLFFPPKKKQLLHSEMSQDALKAKGNDAFKVKNYPVAIDFYTQAIAVDPNCEAAAALYSNRAASYSALNQHEKALADGGECVRVKPAWLKGHFRKGVALEALGRLDEALKAFDGALNTEPGNEEVQVKINDLRSRIKDRNEKTSPAACPTADDAKAIGNSLFSNGKYERAAEFYTRAIALSPGDSEEKANYYSNRAACRQQIHDYKNVIDDANSALAINPQHVKALLRRAIAYEGQEKWKGALEDYNAVNRLSPGMSNVSQGVMRCQRALRG